MRYDASLFKLPNPVLPQSLHLDLLPVKIMSPNRKRGFDSESIVEAALCRLQERDYGLGNPILGFVHATPNSPLDRKQVDFLVEVQEGMEIELQVKSSWGQARKFEHKMRRLGRLVVVLVVRTNDYIERVLYRLVKSIKLALSKKQRQINNAIEATRARLKPKWNDRCRRFHSARMCH